MAVLGCFGFGEVGSSGSGEGDATADYEVQNNLHGEVLLAVVVRDAVVAVAR